jgi:hypothetical protein
LGEGSTLSAIHDLKKLEPQIDEQIAALPLFSQPIQATLSVLANAIFELLHGASRPATSETRANGGSFVGRMAYLANLLARCSGSPFTLRTVDAMRRIYEIDSNGAQLQRLAAYAHFSELMPQVHRDLYTIGRSNNSFVLDFKPDFASAEAQDILLSELALGFGVAASYLEGEFERLCEFPESKESKVDVNTLKTLYAHNLETIFDLPLISDAALVSLIGVPHANFEKFQAAVWATADYALGMAATLFRRWRKGGGIDNEIEYEAYQWTLPCWDHEYTFSLWELLSGLPSLTVARLADAFAIDFTKGNKQTKRSGDGFFPPLILVPGAVMFVPDLVLNFVHLRNVLYGIQKADPKAFDKIVSKELEPKLLSVMAALFGKFHNVRVIKNVVWTSGETKGEIDLLVVDVKSKIALQLQVKAPLAPHGQRMVARLETRVQEGIAQLQRFRTLPAHEIDRIINQACCTNLTDIEILDVLACRAAFGTFAVRKELGNIHLLSLPVLALAQREFSDQQDTAQLTAVLDWCDKYIQQLPERAQAKWVRNQLNVEGTILDIPLLKLDDEAIRTDIIRSATTLISRDISRR